MAQSMRGKVLEVLRNLNWLLESHDSFAELIEIKGNTVVIRCEGFCAECDSDCVGVTFREHIPEVELVFSQ